MTAPTWGGEASRKCADCSSSENRAGTPGSEANAQIASGGAATLTATDPVAGNASPGIF